MPAEPLVCDWCTSGRNELVVFDGKSGFGALVVCKKCIRKEAELQFDEI